GGNLDAPTSAFLNNERPNNWFGVRDRTASSTGFKFVLHDSEHTLRNVNEDRTGPWPAGNSAIQGNNAFSYSSPQTIWQQLLHSPEFRMLVADRVQKHCFNGGVLTPQRATELYDREIAKISRAVVAESARWGDAKREPALTRDANWVAAVNSVRSSFFPNRTGIFLNQLRGDGAFPSISAPQFSQRGGSVPFGFEVTLTNPNPAGVIYYTLDGTDPRAPGGAINSASAVAYSGPITLSSFRNIRARVLSGGIWSALDEASFYLQQDFTRLAITELMYNPLPSDTAVADEFEFIEFKNTGNNAIDLSGLSFTSGVSYSFPQGASLAPGAFWVIARNPVEFAKRYPGVTLNGTFTGRLDNTGEPLPLVHVLGGTALSLEYDDDVPWPVAADGYGFSAVNRDPATNSAPESGAKWRASAQVHGSPGADDPPFTIQPVFVNEVVSNPAAASSDAIELYNPNAEPVDLSHWWLSDDRNALKYRIPAGTVIAPGGYLTFTETQFNASPGQAGSFAMSSLGEAAYLLSGNAAGALTGWSHGFEFDAAAQGVSFGRYINSAGEELFPAQSSITLGAPNSGPRVGPVVISELQYHPLAEYDEYVEIRNIMNAPVPLSDLANPANTWQLTGFNYVFPQGASLPAGAAALVVATDPAAFRTKYAIPAAVQIFGAATGSMQDNGERISLVRPDAPVSQDGATVIPYIVVDSVRYNDKAPWPPGADGSGPSLQKITSTSFGDDPANWFASGTTPGAENTLNQTPSVTLTSPANDAIFTVPTNIVLQATAVDPDGTIAKVEFYDGGTKIGEATSAPYSFAWSGASPGPHTLTARAVDMGLAVGISSPVTINVNIGSGANNGLGLRAEYYNNITLTGAPVVVRTDSTVNLPSIPTPAGVNAENISVRWSGQVLPRTTGTYTFYTVTDDGVRLWVNGEEIISNWTLHGSTEDIGFIDLVAGKLYDIRMEWYQGAGGAEARLSWSATGLPKQLIPSSQLYPAGIPRIVSQPQAQTVERGTAAAFTVVAGGGTNTYQWLRNNEPIPGATSESLALPDVQQAQAGTYTVKVTNSGTTVTSDGALLTVTFTDTDGDGIQDWWETAQGLDPNSNADATLDLDGDGVSNRDEYLAGTNAKDSNSFLRLTVSPADPAGQSLSFTAQSNKSYTVCYKNSPEDPEWIPLQNVAPAVGVRAITVTDPYTGPKRFYRVVTPALP
ncbi:MAG: lamin tail domain-containing protein, partial [Chthoniobacteraceae bacterium]